MKKIPAKVVGVVSGMIDGKKRQIPVGLCEIEDSKDTHDVIVSWDQHVIKLSAAIPMHDYEQYCQSGDIKIKLYEKNKVVV
jgi:hypothetical protein